MTIAAFAPGGTAISVLTRLTSPHSTTERPELPLYQARGAGDAYTLASLIYDMRRDRPLVLVAAHPRGYLVDVSRLVDRLGDRADVVLLADRAVSTTLAEAASPTLSLSGGAIRVVSPGAQDGDSSRRHPQVWVDPDDPDASAEAIAQTDTMVSRVLARGTHDSSDADDLAKRSHELQHKVDSLNADLKTTRDQVRQLRSERDTLRDELDEEHQRVFTDPLAQFRHELYLAWLRDTEESERDDSQPGPSWPLHPWTVADGFLDSIEQQQVISRSRIMRACVDVITGRVAERGSRQAHKMKQRKRDDVIWRCYISQNSPSAPRLHWRHRDDNTVELIYVGLHDDLSFL